MRLAWTLLALVSLAARPAEADKRLDQAVAKADAQLARGKEDEAVKILQKAVAQAPRDPEPPLALASLLTRLGRRDQAAAAVATAGERAGNAPPAVRARVRTIQSALALREGGAGEALAFAQQAVEASAGGESLAALARAQARLGLAAARATAERAVVAAPDSAATHVASGDALFAARLDAGAEEAFRRAVQLDPRSVAGGAGLARVLAARGQAQGALEAARAAMQADPQAAEAQAALALSALALDPEDKKGEAVVAAQQATSLEPQNPLPKLALGRVFESRGQLEQAREAYGEAAALDPSWPAPRIAVLGVRLRQGDADGALSALRALPEGLRTTGDGELLLGRLLAQKEEWTGAVAAFDRAAALLPGLAEAQALRGDAAYNAGELKLAADAYGRAVELSPGNLAYRSSLALYLGYDGRREEAIAALLEVTATPEGQTPATLLALGGIYRSLEPPRVAEAAAAYEKALKLDPRSGEAAMGVARSYRAGRQWARAIAAYERVSTAFPRLDREALLGTAWCYYQSGDDTRARFYTGLAARAGADVEPLRRALSRGGAATDDGERAELVEGLRSKNAGDQARAVKGLLELGRPAVPALAAALGRTGTSLAARELIVDGLGRLGPGAREALPQLDRLAGTAPSAPRPQESDEDKALREREARLAASARAASERIRGRRVDAP
jgi:tetratricopeptide (TPR) repeat protein